MKRYNMGDPMPVSGDVVIIGGGFTAVDCARAARRLLGEEHRVTAIMYRRGEEHMSASPDEIWQLRLEGIDVGTLVNPARVRTAKTAWSRRSSSTATCWATNRKTAASRPSIACPAATTKCPATR